MQLVEVGVIARPHGFRGAFVVIRHSGRDSALKTAPELWMQGKAHKVKEASWMPKGWKVHVEGIESDDQVKSLRGAKVYVDRGVLPHPKDNEFYVTDLIGAQVIDTETNQVIGQFDGLEDQWWKVGNRLIPPKKHFIDSVDVAKKQIRLKNLRELP